MAYYIFITVNQFQRIFLLQKVFMPHKDNFVTFTNKGYCEINKNIIFPVTINTNKELQLN